jgi:hypothetical protein
VVRLYLFDRAVEHLSKGNLVELLLYGLVEHLNCPFCLGPTDSDPRVLHVVETKKELIGVRLLPSAVLRSVALSTLMPSSSKRGRALRKSAAVSAFSPGRASQSLRLSGCRCPPTGRAALCP